MDRTLDISCISDLYIEERLKLKENVIQVHDVEFNLLKNLLRSWKNEPKKIGFILRDVGQLQVSKISYSQYANFSINENENQETVIKTYKLEVKSRLSFLSDHEHLSNMQALTTAFPDSKCISLYKDNHVVSLLMIRKFEYQGESVSLLSWVWNKKELPIADKQIQKSFINDQLRCFFSKAWIASVHIQNEASINFFSNLKFKVTCLIF